MTAIANPSSVVAHRARRTANHHAGRSAAASEEAVAIRNRQDADAVAAAAPKVELVVEYVSGNLYRLRNVGKLAAKSVTTDLTGLEEFADELPTGVDLGPGEHAGGEVEGAVTAAGRRGASRRPAVPTR